MLGQGYITLEWVLSFKGIVISDIFGIWLSLLNFQRALPGEQTDLVDVDCLTSGFPQLKVKGPV